MGKAKKPRNETSGQGAAGNGEGNGWKPRGHVIRFPDKQARLRGIMALGRVPFTHCGLPGGQFGVMDEHLEYLRKEGIPFEIL